MNLSYHFPSRKSRNYGTHAEGTRLRRLANDRFCSLERKHSKKLQFEERISRLPNRTEQNKVMERTTSWKEEGRKEGLEEGRQQIGPQIILCLLKRRWGEIP